MVAKNGEKGLNVIGGGGKVMNRNQMNIGEDVAKMVKEKGRTMERLTTLATLHFCSRISTVGRIPQKTRNGDRPYEFPERTRGPNPKD